MLVLFFSNTSSFLSRSVYIHDFPLGAQISVAPDLALLSAPSISKYTRLLFYSHYSHLLLGKTQLLAKDILCHAAMAGIEHPKGIQAIVGVFLLFFWLHHMIHVIHGVYSTAPRGLGEKLGESLHFMRSARA